MIGAVKLWGGKLYKTYRIYEKGAVGIAAARPGVS